MDGLRALSVLWVVFFHGVLFLGPHLDPGTMATLSGSAWGRFALQGELGVDGFFVISGFLITGLLAREHEAEGTIRLGRFYGRRALRLLPACYVVLLFCAWLTPENRHTAWANLLYVNNFVPFADAFMGWGWSLAIEEQFYAVFPWVLPALVTMRPRRAVGLLVGLILGSVLLRAILAEIAGIGPYPHHPLWISGGVAEPDFVAHWDWLYTRPWTRGGALLVGVLLALLARRSPPSTWPAGRLAGLGAALILPVLLVPRATPPGFEAWLPHGLGMAYLAAFHTVFAVGVGCLLASALAGGRVARVLDSRLLFPIAQLSYSIYLVNPLATGFWYALLAATGQPMDLVGWQVGGALYTLVNAVLLYVLVERPFLALRR